MDKVRNDMEEEVYKKLEEDGGRKMIYKLAHDRDEGGKDMKRGVVIEDGGGRLVADSGGGIEGVRTVFQSAVKPGRKQWRAGGKGHVM